ncbi:recombinase family protein [Novosphingobium sediminicola]|uniref:DNA invertase Pin-like site-specific DNA recombinase n=1 Tax=Novosphingobium sediminicola TaxID=563162 RepID=A0A7W6CFC7_9SPHN|nr:recombinase family protein [Novosphingobium sediminicola]MBB3954812.1 DNA invertase Pin-like site-specific DNA recombinase [Novosphingobium sediminicola]
MEAWIYARFSSDKQADGYSLERQLTEGRAFVESMGWQHSAGRTIKDEGRSAFDGSNREEGAALFDFERKARSGQFNHGVILCVENIDRLSRQGAKAAAQLIWMLNEHGVSVATWHDRHIYRSGDDGDMMDIFSIVIKAQVANEESVKKSKRSLASWAKKKENIRQGSKMAMSNSIPQWLSVGVSGIPCTGRHNG